VDPAASWILQLGRERRGTGPARRPVVADLRSTKKAAATCPGSGEAAAPALCNEDRALGERAPTSLGDEESLWIWDAPLP
jgi:hypothetical protein